MNGPSIYVDDLRRRFGTVTALDGIYLALEDAEIVGIAGPNGAGKTTLIEVLLGLLEPTDGRVKVIGIDPLAFGADDRRSPGYMPQREAVYRDSLSGRTSGSSRGCTVSTTATGPSRRRSTSSTSPIGRPLGSPSSRAVWSVGRASLVPIVHDPELLFLDEPTVGLDPELRSTIWDGFRRRRDDDTALIVSTHYLSEVRHCSRVLFLRDGRVLAFDTWPADVGPVRLTVYRSAC